MERGSRLLSLTLELIIFTLLSAAASAKDSKSPSERISSGTPIPVRIRLFPIRTPWTVLDMVLMVCYLIAKILTCQAGLTFLLSCRHNWSKHERIQLHRCGALSRYRCIVSNLALFYVWGLNCVVKAESLAAKGPPETTSLSLPSLKLTTTVPTFSPCHLEERKAGVKLLPALSPLTSPPRDELSPLLQVGIRKEHVQRGDLMCMSHSLGNDGTYGSFYASSPGAGKEVISVASVENTQLTVQTATLSNAHAPIVYYSLTPLPVPNSLPIYALSTDTTVTNDGCDPLPDSTPDLSSYIVLIRRGSCTFVQKVTNAAAKGAKYALVYNNVATPITIDTGNFSAAAISAEDGAYVSTVPTIGLSTFALTSLPFAACCSIRLQDRGHPHLSPNRRSIHCTEPTRGIDGTSIQRSIETAASNLTFPPMQSSFSTYGPVNDLVFKPSVAAPGGTWCPCIVCCLISDIFFHQATFFLLGLGISAPTLFSLEHRWPRHSLPDHRPFCLKPLRSKIRPARPLVHDIDSKPQAPPFQVLRPTVIPYRLWLRLEQDWSTCTMPFTTRLA